MLGLISDKGTHSVPVADVALVCERAVLVCRSHEGVSITVHHIIGLPASYGAEAEPCIWCVDATP